MVDYKWNGRDILFTTFYKNLSLLCKIECSKVFLWRILKRRSPHKPTRKSIKLYKNGSLNGHRKK